MKNLKKMVKVIALGALALSLVGCAGDKKTEKESGEKIKVGAIQYIEHVSLDNALKGFQNRLKEEGLDVEVDVENLQGDQALATTAPKKFQGDFYFKISASLRFSLLKSSPRASAVLPLIFFFEVLLSSAWRFFMSSPFKIFIAISPACLPCS